MAIVEREKYSPQKINKLRDYLQRNSEIGKPIEFEILVDGLKAVQRTADPEHFDLHEALIDGDTVNMEIIFYKGSSNHNERRLYSFKENSKDKGSLSGIEIEARVEEGLLKFKHDTEFELLKRENAELREEAGELEEKIENLENSLEEMEAKLSPLNKVIGQVGASFVESLIKNNPQLLSAIPGGQTLAGLIGSEEKLAEAPHTDNEVSFKTKEGPDTPAISEQDKASVEFMNNIKSHFNQEQFNKIIEVLNAFVDNVQLIDEAVGFLKGGK